METMFLGIVVFLFLLAIFDLVVGVSNDAVNFMNSAIGAKAASFKTIIAIAALGIFIGATLSNGMMDIARHGIFRPEQFLLSGADVYLSGCYGNGCRLTGHFQLFRNAYLNYCIYGV